MKRKERQQGMAVAEIALITAFLLVPLTLCLIEGGRALNAYTALCDASRAAARQVVVTGDTAGIQTLISSVAGPLDPDNLSTNIILDPDNGMVTVEVAYAHQWIFGNLAQSGGLEGLTLTASTCMPMP